jgi:hypothetical protein
VEFPVLDPDSPLANATFASTKDDLIDDHGVSKRQQVSQTETPEAFRLVKTRAGTFPDAGAG